MSWSREEALTDPAIREPLIFLRAGSGAAGFVVETKSGFLLTFPSSRICAES